MAQDCDHWDATILLVDDQAITVRWLHTILTAAGYQAVEGTTNPHEVVALIQAFHPDLVVLDSSMPQLDGFAVLAQLQRSAAGATPAILMLAPDPSTEGHARALREGATAVLPKPFFRREVLDQVSALLCHQLHGGKCDRLHRLPPDEAHQSARC
jgi:DNA-binding response OmpR family regulator